MNIKIHKSTTNSYYVTINGYISIYHMYTKLNIAIEQFNYIYKKNNGLNSTGNTMFANMKDAENFIENLTPYIIAKKLGG